MFIGEGRLGHIEFLEGVGLGAVVVTHLLGNRAKHHFILLDLCIGGLHRDQFHLVAVTILLHSIRFLGRDLHDSRPSFKPAPTDFY